MVTSRFLCPSLRQQLEESKIQTEYERLQRLVAKITPELFEMVNPHKKQVK